MSQIESTSGGTPATSRRRTWIIGSDASCDVVVDEPVVSSFHCRLIQTSKGFFLQDLRSTNGTCVNGKPISGRVQVHSSSVITLGTNIAFPWPQKAPSKGLRILLIGRDNDNDVVLDDSSVSGQHARLMVSKAGIVLDDLGAANGVFVGNQDNRIRRVAVTPDDLVFFGSFRVRVADLLKPKKKKGTQVKTSTTATFGRDDTCTFKLDHPLASRQHARLTATPQGHVLEDLGSINGTFINGKRIQGACLLKPNDNLFIGGMNFIYTAQGKLEPSQGATQLTIEAFNVSVDVPGRRLIDDVSLCFKPGEFVGLMGPSGAGKTTLMNVLNGYSPPAEGKVLINGIDLYSHYSEFRGLLGYVPQDDIIHRDLTVGEALYYTAKLRLPLDYSEADIEARVSSVLKQLGLEATRDVLVGSPEKKGISGGQRKRVNLAMEMLTDPPVLFLDEPTSGLSSEDALIVMKLLRQLADSGKVILLTIHQPSLEAYRQMDHLVLLSKDTGSAEPARLAYFGPAFPDAIHFFDPSSTKKPHRDLSPDDVFKGLSEHSTREWDQKYQQSAYAKKYIHNRIGKTTANPNQQLASRMTFADWTVQCWTLIQRSLVIKVKDRWNTGILLAQAPIVAILLVMVFGSDVSEEIHDENWGSAARTISMSVFMMGLSALWFGCSNAAREIVGEWAIYRRERMVNLQLPTYILSKVAVLQLLCVVQCLVLTTIVVFGCGLESPPLALFSVLFLASTVGLMIGLLVSSFANTPEVAIGLLPIILIPMVILGGVMQPLHKMNSMMESLAYLAPSRWAFEGMLVSESARQPLGPSPYVSASDKEAEPETDDGRPDMAERYFRDVDRVGSRACKIVLVAMSLFLAGCTYIVLRLRDIH